MMMKEKRKEMLTGTSKFSSKIQSSSSQVFPAPVGSALSPGAKVPATRAWSASPPMEATIPYQHSFARVKKECWSWRWCKDVSK